MSYITKISELRPKDETEMTNLNMTSVPTMPSNDVTDASGPDPAPPPTITLDDILGMYLEYRVAQVLGIYLFPVLVGLGTIGNLLSFLVLVRKTMRSSSTCFYMMVLAVADTMVLYFSALRKWLSFLNGYDAITQSEFGCKAFTFLSYFSFDWSVWLLVAMTIERFIAIHFPLRAMHMATPARARKVIILLLLIFLAWNCHFFWTVTKDDKNQCTPEEEYASFHDNYVPWLDASVYSFIPFVVLITFNILIIRDTRTAIRNRRTLRGRNHTTNVQTNSRGQQFHQRLTLTLLSVSFTFLVFSCPKVVLIAIRDSQFNFYQDNGFPDFQEISKYVLISRVADLFLYINHSFNFVLYSLHGQRFRKELKELILCRTQRVRRRSTFSLSLDPGATYNRNSNETVMSNYNTVAEHQDTMDHNGVNTKTVSIQNGEENYV